MLKENLENVEQKIQAACERSGRDRSEVTLIAVSKTKPAEMVQEAYDFSHIQFMGLMTSAPFVDNPEENRPIFAELRKLSVDIARKNAHNMSMSILSMGMTNDYEVAIEEGATMVRVGTAIFGARNYAQTNVR